MIALNATSITGILGRSADLSGRVELWHWVGTMILNRPISGLRILGVLEGSFRLFGCRRDTHRLVSRIRSQRIFGNHSESRRRWAVSLLVVCGYGPPPRRDSRQERRIGTGSLAPRLLDIFPASQPRRMHDPLAELIGMGDLRGNGRWRRTRASIRTLKLPVPKKMSCSNAAPEYS